MISPLAFDALLAGAASGNVPPPSSSHSSHSPSPPSDQNAVLFVHSAENGGKNGRKRKLSRGKEERPSTRGENEKPKLNSHDSNGSPHSPPFPPNGLMSLVEQQLAASSPNGLFQQSILDAAQKESGEDEIEGEAEGEQPKEQQFLIGEEATTTGMEVEGQQQMMEFLEAQRAFQKLCNQFTGFDQQQQQPRANPFLAQISPFLLALQSQQHFASPFCAQSQLDPATLFGHHSLLHSATHSTTPKLENGAGIQQQDDEQDEGDSEGTNAAGQHQRTEPEDLSIKRGRIGEEDCGDRESGRNTGSGCGTQQPVWNYEEQFKPLYDINNEPERKEWLDDWLLFMQRINKSITRIPIMAKQVLDLFELYKLVVQHGGLVEVINKKLWREITKGLNLPSTITSAAFTLRSQYSRYLYDYECHQHNFSTHADLTAAVDGNKREGRRPQGSGGGSTPSAISTTGGPQHPHRSSSSSANVPSNEQFTQMMAAALSAAPPGTFPAGFPALPPPSMAAAAFFGKQLVNFGATQRDLDQMNALSTATKQAFQQQFGLQLDSSADFVATNSENLFPKLDFITPSSNENGQQIGGGDDEQENHCREEIMGMDNGSRQTPPQSSTTINNSSRPHSQQSSTATGTGPAAKRIRLDSNKQNGNGGKTTVSSTPPSNSSYQFVQGSRQYFPNSSTASNNAAAMDLSPSNVDETLPLGTFGQFLKNASRCNLKVNADPRILLDKNCGAQSTSVASSSMVVSMELNGVLYQGVLFAIPPDGGSGPIQNAEADDGGHDSPNSHKHSISTNKQREVEAN